MTAIGIGAGMEFLRGSRGGAPAWSPLSLFASGEMGWWYDYSDLSTMWTDTAGTIPAAENDAIARVDDKSGNGLHGTQSTFANRPILRRAGALYYLEFATDDFFVTPSANFSGTDAVSSIVGLRKVSDATIGEVFGLSTTPGSTNGTFGLRAPGGSGVGNYRLISRGSASANNVPVSSTYAAPRTDVLSTNSRISTDTNILRVNGVEAINGTTDQGTGNFSNNPAYIGRTAGTSNALNGWVYGQIVRGALTEGDARTNAEAWMAAKTGVTL